MSQPPQIDKAELIGRIRRWLTLDEEIKALSRKAKEKRAQKKEITDGLIGIMRHNEIDCFDVQDGKLLYTRSKVRKPLSKKHLLASLQSYFQNDVVRAKEIGTFIMNSREANIKEGIRRKIQK